MGISCKEHVIDRLYRIQEVINLLSAKEYVTKSPKIFLDYLTQINSLLLNRTLRIQDEDEVSLRRIENFSQMIHFYLDDVEHINTINIPLELLPILKDVLTDNGISHHVLFRPDTDFNYYFVNFTHNLKEEFLYLGNLPNIDLSIIGFPLSERHNVLLNCMLFHELGHLLNEELKIRSKINTTYLEITEKDISYYHEVLKKRYEQFKRTVRIDKVNLYDFYEDEDAEKRSLIEDVNVIFSNWLNEITSDLIAFYYLGASYLLSLAEYSLVHKNANYCTDSHPPLFLRLKILFKLYNAKKHSEKLKKYMNITKYIAKYKKIAKISFNDEKELIYALRYSIIEKKLLNLSHELISTLEKSLVVKNTDFIQIRIEDSITSILSLIPPVEFITETKTIHTHTPYTILNAAWIVKENYKSKLYEIFPNNNQKGRIVISKLTCKALELINFKRKMRE